MASSFDFDCTMADLTNEGLEEQPQHQQLLAQVPQQLPRHSQAQQLQQQVLQQEQLQQHFNASFNNHSFHSTVIIDSVLDEACAAVTSLEDARSLYAGMLHNWNPEEERLYWSDSDAN
jgi:hypothetical protein